MCSVCLFIGASLVEDKLSCKLYIVGGLELVDTLYLGASPLLAGVLSWCHSSASRVACARKSSFTQRTSAAFWFRA